MSDRRWYQMGTTIAIVALVLAILSIYMAGTAHGQEVEYTSADTVAAIEQYSVEFGVSQVWLTRTVDCETGGTFSNYKVGRQGELGAAQLHPRGELRRFYDYGYWDPTSPWQSIRFMAQRFAWGGASAWTCS